MTTDEELLEEVRERIHSPDATAEDIAEFKALSQKVADARQASRLEREAAGPPEPENEGDAVVRPGMVS
jgi:chorismate mutase